MACATSYLARGSVFLEDSAHQCLTDCCSRHGTITHPVMQRPLDAEGIIAQAACVWQGNCRVSAPRPGANSQWPRHLAEWAGPKDEPAWSLAMACQASPHAGARNVPAACLAPCISHTARMPLQGRPLYCHPATNGPAQCLRYAEVPWRMCILIVASAW